VLFLDDDDLADPSLIAEHIAMHRRWPAPEHAVLGYTKLSPQLSTDPFMHFISEVGCYLFSYGSLSHGDVLDYSFFWGGRTSCKRSFLVRHGVFNPRFTFGCEDIELGFRLSRHGLRVIYNRLAVSTMIRGISLDDFCERLRRQGRSNAVFGRLHEDAGVRAWTRIDEARARGIALEARHDAIIGAARHLDAMLRRKIALGLSIESSELECTHRAYRAACETSLLGGISEGLDSSAQTDRPVTSR
jgi:GT2 family glycosyltransferase